jgi:UDP-2,3-diacylglucosamine pyrophosphatase LpxH
MPGMMPLPVVDPSAVAREDVRPTAACTAIEFIDTWVNRTMYKTTQASHVRDFLQFSSDASKFLQGNHDNYLGAHTPSELMKLRGGQGMAKEHHDAKALFYACHGHQWDSFNRDGATAGLGTTQAAFWGGKWIRSMEPDDRESSFLGSVDLFRSGKKPFNVFAMGHTHTAILTEVVIEIEPEPPPPPPVDYMPIGP